MKHTKYTKYTYPLHTFIVELEDKRLGWWRWVFPQRMRKKRAEGEREAFKDLEVVLLCELRIHIELIALINEENRRSEPVGTQRVFFFSIACVESFRDIPVRKICDI